MGNNEKALAFGWSGDMKGVWVQGGSHWPWLAGGGGLQRMWGTLPRCFQIAGSQCCEEKKRGPSLAGNPCWVNSFGDCTPVVILVYGRFCREQRNHAQVTLGGKGPLCFPITAHVWFVMAESSYLWTLVLCRRCLQIKDPATADLDFIECHDCGKMERGGLRTNFILGYCSLFNNHLPFVADLTFMGLGTLPDVSLSLADLWPPPSTLS